jgi:dipeptidyl aminopeptidase/acylaminoacyl peptidase
MRRLIRACGPAAAALLFAVTPLASTTPTDPAAQASGRPLQIEDYYRVKNVGGPSISPDSRWVAFTATTRVEDDEDASRSTSEGWFVPMDGSAAPTRLRPEASVTNLRWLDDSWLQYSIERQTWKVDPANPGSDVLVEEAPVEAAGRGGRGGRGAAGGGTPSPDGTWRAETRDVPAPRPEPRYASDFEKRHQERFEGAIFDWKDFLRDGQPLPAPNPALRPVINVVLTPAGGGAAKTIVDAALRPSGLAWNPDGKMLAFVADPDWRDDLRYESAELYTVTVDGALTRLTDDDYSYANPGFSPDGRYLSYTRTYSTNLIISRKLDHGGPRDLYIRAVAGGEPINLTADWDLEPGSPQWSPDGRFIYFTAGVGGESHLFRTSVPAGRVEQITQGTRRLNGLVIDRTFTKIAYGVGAHEAPGDLYSADIDGTNEIRLTDMHADFTREVALSRAERLEWPSYDGTRIEGWLLFPHGYDAAKGPYPMVVTSHGGPHAATGYSFNFKNQYFAANGYFVLDTNFRGSTGYGDAFKWAIWGQWGTLDGQDVMSGVDHVLKRYPIDPKRVGHIGHSYGGFMTNWLITQYPDRFAAAVSGAGISNWISDYGTADIYRTKETEFFGPPWDDTARDIMIRQSPITFAGRVRTPTLFVHGEVDYRVPLPEAQQMYFALRRQGVPAKMIVYKGQAHGIGGNWNVVHRMIQELAWWEQYLKPSPATTTTQAR